MPVNIYRTKFSVCLFTVILGMYALTRADTAKADSPYKWSNVEVVGGGFVDGISYSTKQPNLIYARTDIGGAYRWNTKVRRWIPLTDWIGETETNLLGTESIALDPADANRVYLAQGTYTKSWASNGAILRSTDQGRTWKRTDVPFKMGSNEDGRSMGERLSVDPSQHNVLYFGSRRDGLWRSRDYGISWNRVTNFPVPADMNGIGVVFTLYDTQNANVNSTASVIYVGAANSLTPLYCSMDSGATWSAVQGQPQGLIPHHAVITSEGMLYVTYGNAPGPNGMSSGAVWKYSTHSGIWTNITPLQPGSADNGIFGYAGLSVDARHPNTILVSTMDWWSHHDEIFRSTDGGVHWTGLKAHAVEDAGNVAYMRTNDRTPALGHWIGALQIDPFNSGHVLFGTGATIWGSDDVTAADTGGVTHWTIRAQGLEETAVLDLISPPTGAHLLSALGDIGGFRHDNLSLPPAQGSFQNPAFSTTSSLDFAQNAPNIMVRTGSPSGAASSHGALSQDGGRSWTPFPAEPSGSKGAGHAALSADGKTILWTPSRSVLSYSRDNGATWTVSTGLPGTLRAIADRANPQGFYAANTDTNQLFISADGGASFHAAPAPLPVGGGKLSAVPGHEGDLWLTASGGLYHSPDAGTHWLPSLNVQSSVAIGYGKAAPGHAYPALYLDGKVNEIHGIYRSIDSAKSWLRINDNAHQYGWLGQAITGDPRVYGRLYLATNGRGIIMGEPEIALR